MTEDVHRNQLLESLDTGDPNTDCRTLKNITRSKTSNVSSLIFENTNFLDRQVPDGIYENIRLLKSEPVKNHCEDGPNYDAE